MEENVKDGLLDIIRQAKLQGIHKDQFKGALMDQMGARSKYVLRGRAGAAKLGEDLGEIFKFIDDNWDETHVEDEGGRIIIAK